MIWADLRSEFTAFPQPRPYEQTELQGPKPLTAPAHWWRRYNRGRRAGATKQARSGAIKPTINGY